MSAMIKEKTMTKRCYCGCFEAEHTIVSQEALGYHCARHLCAQFEPSEGAHIAWFRDIPEPAIGVPIEIAGITVTRLPAGGLRIKRRERGAGYILAGTEQIQDMFGHLRSNLQLQHYAWSQLGVVTEGMLDGTIITAECEPRGREERRDAPRGEGHADPL